MAVDQAELDRRINFAREAMRENFLAGTDEFGVRGFIEHHLQEVEAENWQEMLGISKPEAVLEILVLQGHSMTADENGLEPGADHDGLQGLDFTPPNEVTNYLFAVEFDADGIVERLGMES